MLGAQKIAMIGIATHGLGVLDAVDASPFCVTVSLPPGYRILK